MLTLHATVNAPDNAYDVDIISTSEESDVAIHDFQAGLEAVLGKGVSNG